MKIKLLRGIGVLIILIGVVFLLNKPIKNYSIAHTGDKYGIDKLDRKELKKNETAKATFDFEQVKPLDIASVASAQLQQLSGKELPVIASIAIPSVHIRLPIFKGLSNENLLYGAGTVSEEQKMGKGNYSLASHRSDQPTLLFTPIENMNKGDLIYLTDLENVYVYQTVSVKKVSPTSVEVLDYQEGTTPIVTLLTCGDLYARSRIVVQGTLSETIPLADISDEIAEAFELPIQSY
ncbi:class A sortase (plasmid) [Enterococcus sp. 22-H-5-01]|uniref:class A sortase n=1 Tax=Enterococcus sp. 22-H-5-01 TaxID=3418555 RepID=UPI003CFFB923